VTALPQWLLNNLVTLVWLATVLIGVVWASAQPW
jgi:hypothetical protein